MSTKESFKDKTIDVREVIAQGGKVKVADDLTVGAIPETKAKVDERITRKVEEWSGVPPMNDGKVPKVFIISEFCGLTDPKLKNGKCSNTLEIHRIMNQKYEKDEIGSGGQIQYLQNDVKYFKICAIHGPFVLPEAW